MSFSFFGCWNQGYCGDNPFSYVASHIKKNSTDFVIVAGDNYYPTKDKGKGKKTKLFNELNFESGFNCLSGINKDTYILMGNHDVQYEKKLVDSINKNSLDKCHIIGRQLEKKSKKLSFENRYITTDDALILFLNTSLYTSDKDEMLDCFKEYKKNIEQPDESSIDAFIDEEYDFFTTLVKELASSLTSHKLIIVGHHPVVSVRDKKPIESLSYDGLFLLNELYSLFNSNDKYYLCADVHQFQEGIVKLNEHNITQYVVGTGGTTLDDIKCKKTGEHLVYSSQDMSISYEMEYCDNKNYGYLIYENGEFKFTKVDTSPDGRYSSITKTSPKTRTLSPKTRTLSSRTRTLSPKTVSIPKSARTTKRRKTPFSKKTYKTTSIYKKTPK